MHGANKAFRLQGVDARVRDPAAESTGGVFAAENTLLASAPQMAAGISLGWLRWQNGNVIQLINGPLRDRIVLVDNCSVRWRTLSVPRRITRICAFARKT